MTRPHAEHLSVALCLLSLSAHGSASRLPLSLRCRGFGGPCAAGVFFLSLIVLAVGLSVYVSAAGAPRGQLAAQSLTCHRSAHPSPSSQIPERLQRLIDPFRCAGTPAASGEGGLLGIRPAAAAEEGFSLLQEERDDGGAQGTGGASSSGRTDGVGRGDAGDDDQVLALPMAARDVAGRQRRHDGDATSSGPEAGSRGGAAVSGLSPEAVGGGADNSSGAEEAGGFPTTGCRHSVPLLPTGTIRGMSTGADTAHRTGAGGRAGVGGVVEVTGSR